MYYEIQYWADEVAQQAKASAPKCDKLNSVRGAHVVNEEELFKRCSLTSKCVPWHTPILPSLTTQNK